ncbi:MAG: beta-ketoacyl synthase N-terminal-like domain-containing protein, partial [Deltaproteobacteria bacterium]
MKRRVVITGVGIVTAHGTGYEANLEGMRLGRDSIAAIRSFDVSAYRGKTGGEAFGFSFKRPLQKLRRKRLDRSSQFLLTAFEEARLQSGILRAKHCSSLS